MDSESQPRNEIARKSETAAIQAISRVGGVELARALETSESTVSRIKNEELPRVVKLLAAAGIKCVPIEMRCYEPSVIQAIFVLARRKLDRISDPGVELSWEDGE